jgi:hypothetical protein
VGVRTRADPLAVVFGSREGEYLAIEVLRRPYADRADVSDGAYDWDANWLSCRIEARLRGFRARFDAFLMTSDFPPFRDALRRLWEDLRGEAVFETLEKQVLLRVRGDGLGHMTVSGQLEDIAGMGNRLSFALELDQTHIAATLRDLDDLLERFPVC